MEESEHVSLGLRLALLESLTLGDAHSYSNQELVSFNSTLFLRSSNAQSQFLQSIDKYKPILQFVNDYKDNQAYLQPTTANPTENSSILNSVSSSSNRNFSLEEGGKKEEQEENSTVSLLNTRSIISLLLESEPDIRQLDRDLRMCEHHYERSTAGAGKLADYESLAPRLAALREQASNSSHQEADIEKRLVQILDTYSIQIDAMSKLFINWDHILTQTEDALTRLERSQY